MKKLYLDTCCYNRPFNDQNDEKIHKETGDILRILELVESEKVKLFISGAILAEIHRLSVK